MWTGAQALDRGLVDHIGGLWRALQVADELCGVRGGGVRGISARVDGVLDGKVRANSGVSVNATGANATGTTTDSTDYSQNANTSANTTVPKVYRVEIMSGAQRGVLKFVGSVLRMVSGGGDDVRGARGVLRLIRRVVLASGGRVSSTSIDNSIGSKSSDVQYLCDDAILQAGIGGKCDLLG